MRRIAIRASISGLTGGLAAVAIVLAQASAAMAQDKGPMSNAMGSWMEQVVKKLAGTIARATEVLQNAPKLPVEWSAAVKRIFFSDSSALQTSFGDIRLWLFLAAMIAATDGLPILLCRRYNRPEGSVFWKAIKRLAFELIGIGIAFGLAAVAAATILTGPNADNEAGFELLWIVVRWRLSTMLAIVLLRPDAPDIRLLPISTEASIRIRRTAYISLAIIIGFMTVIPFFRRYGVSTGSAQVTALFMGTLSVAVFMQALRQLSKAMPGHDGVILLLGGTIAVTT